jgi:hypothetical protein
MVSLQAVTAGAAEQVTGPAQLYKVNGHEADLREADPHEITCNLAEQDGHHSRAHHRAGREVTG